MSGERQPRWSPRRGVGWADDGTLAAAAADTGVYLSADRGATWSKVGDLPALPEALLAVDEHTLVAAVEERGIYESTDGGRAWRLRYRDKSPQSS